MLLTYIFIRLSGMTTQPAFARIETITKAQVNSRYPNFAKQEINIYPEDKHFIIKQEMNHSFLPAINNPIALEIFTHQINNLKQ